MFVLTEVVPPRRTGNLPISLGPGSSDRRGRGSPTARGRRTWRTSSTLAVQVRHPGRFGDASRGTLHKPAIDAGNSLPRPFRRRSAPPPGPETRICSPQLSRIMIAAYRAVSAYAKRVATRMRWEVQCLACTPISLSNYSRSVIACLWRTRAQSARFADAALENDSQADSLDSGHPLRRTACCPARGPGASGSRSPPSPPRTCLRRREECPRSTGAGRRGGRRRHSLRGSAARRSSAG
jgi:hypothetical protein